MSDGLDHLKGWIGRTETATDLVTAGPLAGLAAILDHDAPPWPPGEVPPLGHWLWFLPKTLQRDIGPDGHARRGGFLPPVELPRRMWAGGALDIVAPLKVGERITRRSTIVDVTPKAGRSGQMVFVQVAHEVSNAAGPVLSEVHDIVYRAAPRPGDPDVQPDRPTEAALWQRTIVPDIVLLFRFSALTFNGHRIHYDRDYCRRVEGYPGLVVHGPLLAVLLVDLFLRANPGRTITSFRFRAKRPVFDRHPFTVCGAPASGGAALWVLDHDGQVAMAAAVVAR